MGGPLRWIAVLLDGFDAVVLGAAMPKLTGDPAMGVTNANGAWLLTASLIGMTLGALGMGWLTDRLGRRRLLITAVVAFSLLTVLTGFATAVWQIGVLRFLAGAPSTAALPVQHPYGDAAPLHAPGQQRSGAALLPSSGYARNTVFVWIASFMGLMLVYGLNSWLPQIMRAAKYDLGNALGFLLVLNAGAVVGLLVAGRVGDAITPRNAAIAWFLGSAVLLCALVVKLPLAGISVMVFVTGVFVFSAQNLVDAFTATNDPPQVRGTALGMSAGVGRLGAISGPLVGGALLTAGIAYPWGFFAFAAAGLLGGAAASGLRTLRRA